MNSLTQNTAVNNSLNGILLNNSQYNTLTGNNASSNALNGIILTNSTQNTLNSNIANNNRQTYGIYLNNSAQNTLINNSMSGNSLNFGLDGTTDQDYVQNIDRTNLVNGKSIIYLYNGNRVVIDRTSNAGMVIAINGTNLVLENLNLTTNEYGVYFRNTKTSSFFNVTASGNLNGITLDQGSSGNSVDDSSASGNHLNGLLVQSSNSNIITDTRFSNNGQNGIVHQFLKFEPGRHRHGK